MRRRVLPSSAVTWSGNQTAKDGGLDVRVAAGTPIDGFIPKPQTDVQVKKLDMPRAEIVDEMKPKPARVLRPVIVELADADGAYIIVSSDGSTADSALRNRREAMAEAVNTSAGGKLVLDFYDRNRVATWVRDHAGLIPWVRSRIGKAVPGGNLTVLGPLRRRVWKRAILRMTTPVSARVTRGLRHRRYQPDPQGARHAGTCGSTRRLVGCRQDAARRSAV